MKVIGLTGGIASGKSLVAGILRELGAIVIDADAIAREVVEPGTEAWKEIVGSFGEEYLLPSGHVDRKKLARKIFQDPAAREKLEAITHPRIRQRMFEEVERQRSLDNSCRRIVILDIPLLFETGRPPGLDGVIVVYANEEVLIERLIARDGLTREEAELRLRAQMPLSEKVQLADWVIDNNGPPEATRAQVEALWRELTGDRGLV
ncbi:MAG: dephospho-CoA kinase [Armatimonadota bacterium]|nr:dephospho-CoA kinase [Armatimonadota bacterium]